MEDGVKSLKGALTAAVAALTALWGWFGWLVAAWVACMARHSSDILAQDAASSTPLSAQSSTWIRFQRGSASPPASNFSTE